jgi:hypothetical protein
VDQRLEEQAGGLVGVTTALRCTCQLQHADTAHDPTPVQQASSSNRPSWFPGTKFPAHLDGSLPGDHGFDPLSLGTDPAKLKW